MAKLNTFSPADMIAAIEHNLSGMVQLSSVSGRYSATEPAGVKRSIVDIPYALFNSISDATLEPIQVEQAIQFIIADVRKRRIPVQWWIGPSSRPADLEKHLVDNGFKLHDDDPGMAVELSKLDEGLRKVPGLSIQIAQDKTAWYQWGRTMAAGFGVPPAAEFIVQAWVDLFTLVDPDIVSAYTGLLDGQPVATSVLAQVGGAAGIYGVSTIPVARRKGIGAWMTLQPLLDARAKGQKVGVLQASQMGAGVYRSLGFQEYCQIRSYQFRA
ncbi:MAG TPA: hypothetical protein VF831_11310 [Anaerolineales bacterium]